MTGTALRVLPAKKSRQAVADAEVRTNNATVRFPPTTSVMQQLRKILRVQPTVYSLISLPVLKDKNLWP